MEQKEAQSHLKAGNVTMWSILCPLGAKTFKRQIFTWILWVAFTAPWKKDKGTSTTLKGLFGVSPLRHQIAYLIILASLWNLLSDLTISITKIYYQKKTKKKYFLYLVFFQPPFQYVKVKYTHMYPKETGPFKKTRYNTWSEWMSKRSSFFAEGCLSTPLQRIINSLWYEVHV